MVHKKNWKFISDRLQLQRAYQEVSDHLYS